VGQLLESITISIGIAVFPTNADSAEALVKAADEALYRAKTQGRNRVMVA
jgi:diguanylate cyclase (GGDEF)-like protein